ncbi:hypothetical protein BKA70DRAFT_1113152 [Coprinopsis sp. MPI-PUGE-AT-0042]|nr:hypothetical protein BKA70DRAFT_1113152 [Coprinopsis sp. MPI-PUGE-AT-0042]
MDIVSEAYPDFDHVFVYNNATIHRKRPDGSLSARYMPKNPSARFCVEITKRDAHGKPCYIMGPNGVQVLEKITMQMGPGELPNGEPQSFYFDSGPNQGMFKGMARILYERGFTDAYKLRYECPGFKCVDQSPTAACCCRRLLFNQPDFVNVKSALELECESRGSAFKVLFLPKFHCELNFIEQVWGYAKRLYRLNPASTREEDLERNALESLAAVPLVCMRRFANRAECFADAYRHGPTGAEAVWAAKRYRGHRALPYTIIKEIEEEYRSTTVSH